MEVYKWSKTAASNDAAPPNGAPEGWTGDDVNAVVREAMAQIRTLMEDSIYVDITWQLPAVGAKSLTRVSATRIDLLSCDGTAYFTANRRIRIYGGSPATAYGYVVSSTLNGGNTEITVAMENGDVPTSPTRLFVHVDPTVRAGAFTSPFTTGDAKLTLKTSETGWVIANDGSIGSATSGGTTRANADCENLFKLIWDNVSNSWCETQDSSGVPVARGVSAAADWAANRRIVLPRTLGRALVVAGAGSGLTSRALGEYLGEEGHVQTTGELVGHTHTVPYRDSGGGATTVITATLTTTPLNITSSTAGSTPPAAMNVMQPSSCWTLLVKL